MAARSSGVSSENSLRRWESVLIGDIDGCPEFSSSLPGIVANSACCLSEVEGGKRDSAGKSPLSYTPTGSRIIEKKPQLPELVTGAYGDNPHISRNCMR